MKKLIKKILKEESLKQNLKDQVKEWGWEDVAKLIGDPKSLAELAFNNDPMEFLNMFNDLDIIEDNGYKYYKTKKGENVMLFIPKINKLYIQRHLVSFIKEGFGYSYFNIYELTKDWVKKTFKIKGVNPDFGFMF